MSKKIDILVIDDEQVILDSVVKICHEENLSVATAINAREGLKIISHSSCKLIICDIMLPDLDGFQFLKELKQVQIKLPVIMTSGYSTVENALKSLNHGAIDYLPKPFASDELLSTLIRVLRWIELTKTSTSLPFVPCPHKYYRMGFFNWVNIETDGTAKIGVSDLFLKIIEPIQSINLGKVDDEIVLGDSCALFECSDGYSHQFLSPLTGRIISINPKLSLNKNLIEKDPYFQGWMYTLIPSDLDFEIKYLTHCSSDRI